MGKQPDPEHKEDGGVDCGLVAGRALSRLANRPVKNGIVPYLETKRRVP